MIIEFFHVTNLIVMSGDTFLISARRIFNERFARKNPYVPRQTKNLSILVVFNVITRNFIENYIKLEVE